MIVLVDTNILLDVAWKRMPFFAKSDEVVAWCQDHPGSGVIAWHTVSNLYYLAKKRHDDQTARGVIESVIAIFGVSAASSNAVKQALRYAVNDFEDALQIAVAESAGANFIITRDLAHYAGSPITVTSPEVFLASV